jgi:hypothetical protein
VKLQAIDPFEEAVINHIQYYRFWFEPSPDALKKESEYTKRFFPRSSIHSSAIMSHLILPYHVFVFDKSV